MSHVAPAAASRDTLARDMTVDTSQLTQEQLQQILAKATVRVGGGSAPPAKAAPNVPTLFPAPLQQTAAAFSPVPPPAFHTAHEISSADDPMAPSQPSAASTLAVAGESPAEIMRKALALTGHDKSGKDKGNRH